MARFATLARQLQTAINNYGGLSGVKLLINTRQWFSKEHNRVITIYSVRQPLVEDDHKTVELFSTYSHIQLVLWLRDYWYILNGWEIPTDNLTWEQIKESKGIKYESGIKQGQGTGESDSRNETERETI